MRDCLTNICHDIKYFDTYYILKLHSIIIIIHANQIIKDRYLSCTRITNMDELDDNTGNDAHYWKKINCTPLSTYVPNDKYIIVTPWRGGMNDV